MSTHRKQDGEITALLTQLRLAEADRKEAAQQALLDAVYRELGDLARSRMSREPAGHTLSPTALVHEVYLRLFQDSGDEPAFDNRAHFFTAASEAMRRILVERARRYASQKRGSNVRRVPMSEGLGGDGLWERADDVLAIDQALVRLEAESPRFSQVAKLRYFVGLTAQETADTLQVSLRTVERSWTAARAFLLSDLQRAGASRQEGSA